MEFAKQLRVQIIHQFDELTNVLSIEWTEYNVIFRNDQDSMNSNEFPFSKPIRCEVWMVNGERYKGFEHWAQNRIETNGQSVETENQQTDSITVLPCHSAPFFFTLFFAFVRMPNEMKGTSIKIDVLMEMINIFFLDS